MKNNLLICFLAIVIPLAVLAGVFRQVILITFSADLEGNTIIPFMSHMPT